MRWIRSLFVTKTLSWQNHVAKPQPGIIISVIRWSRLWKWTINKEGLLVAFGVSDTSRDGKYDAEQAWNKIKNNEVPINSYDRRAIGDARILSPKREP